MRQAGGGAEYARRLSGYAITGLTKDQGAYFLCGEGSNGKSVLLELWPWLLGDGYCYTVPSTALMEGSSDRHPTDLMGFRGVRLAIANETEEEHAINESRFKMLTGGDKMVARGMRQNFTEWRPTHKLVIATNHRPRIRGVSHGVWRRPRVVEFPRKFWKAQDRDADPVGDKKGHYAEADRADPDLLDVLKVEAPGVLADMVRHAAEFFRTPFRFDPPRQVVVATEAYRREENRVEQFLKDRTEAVDTDNKSLWMGAKELLALYKQWNEDNGYSEKELAGSRKLGICAKRMYKWGKRSTIIYCCRERFTSEEDTSESSTEEQLTVTDLREDNDLSGRADRFNAHIDHSDDLSPQSSSHPPSSDEKNDTPSRPSRRRVGSDYGDD